MVIIATEFKNSLGHCPDLAATEDVLISKNGRPVSRLTGPEPARAQRTQSLSGILPSTVTVDEARAIRGEEMRGLS